MELYDDGRLSYRNAVWHNVEQPHRVLVQVVPKWTSHGGGLIANFKAWALCKLLAEAGRSRFVEQGGSRLPCPPGRLPIVEQPFRVLLVQVVPKGISQEG